MNSFLWNYMMLHLTTDTLHNQIGLVADLRAKAGRCRHTDPPQRMGSSPLKFIISNTQYNHCNKYFSVFIQIRCQ